MSPRLAGSSAVLRVCGGLVVLKRTTEFCMKPSPLKSAASVQGGIGRQFSGVGAFKIELQGHHRPELSRRLVRIHIERSPTRNSNS
jgi:hypothetical protein